MVASLKNRMIRALAVALVPASLSFGLIGHSFAQAASQASGYFRAVDSGTATDDDGPGLGGGYAAADDDGPGLGGGYAAADDDGPGLGGGYCAAGGPGVIALDGPGSSTPYVID